jgi:2-polyprenyl-3-methyl-5-hydroxy-6-metoxy-1,4-benzoquinol methylase
MTATRVTQVGRYLGRPGRRVLELVFPLLRKFKPARERVVIGDFDDHVEREHLARYHFVKPFCAGKVVADIACGSGYGSEILREVAARVDSYDKEPLCGNFVIDLEKDAWTSQYDVIVSLETIEHLANPEFFLANAARTSRMLIVSSPIGEFKGYNPHHKQTWELDEFSALLARWFTCTFYYQRGETISPLAEEPIGFVIAVCTPRA